MKKRLNEYERSLKQVNLNLNYFDQLVIDGVLSRRELTDIILKRHILSMKHVLKYVERNINCKITFNA